jgi:hypothetical protein
MLGFFLNALGHSLDERWRYSVNAPICDDLAQFRLEVGCRTTRCTVVEVLGDDVSPVIGQLAIKEDRELLDRLVARKLRSVPLLHLIVCHCLPSFVSTLKRCFASA